MILISIAGDFQSSIIPVFYNFKNKITKHIVVYDNSKRDKKNATNLHNGITTFIKKGHYRFESILYRVDEKSLKSIKECAKYILSLTKNPQDIYINTTDGYSTLTTILNHKLFRYGVNFIAYDMFDNQCNILNKSSLKTYNIKNIPTIAEHFMLKGYKTKKSNLKDFAIKNEKYIRKIFEKQSDKYDEFTKLKSKVHKMISDLSGEYKEIKKTFLKMDRSFASLSVDNSLLTGSLFECYVYLLLRDMDYDDIELGMEVLQKYKNSHIKNEFDILIMKNNHLHMIECKFKNYVKVDELVYKYTALSNIIDEDGMMAIVTKKAHCYNDDIDLDKNRGLSYKRGILSNIYFYGDVHHNKLKFQKEIKGLFGL